MSNRIPHNCRQAEELIAFHVESLRLIHEAMDFPLKGVAETSTRDLAVMVADRIRHCARYHRDDPVDLDATSNRMTKPTLAPCPWCPVPPQLISTHDRKHHYVACMAQESECPVRPEGPVEESAEKASRQWNKRSPDPRIAALEQQVAASGWQKLTPTTAWKKDTELGLWLGNRFTTFQWHDGNLAAFLVRNDRYFYRRLNPPAQETKDA